MPHTPAQQKQSISISPGKVTHSLSRPSTDSDSWKRLTHTNACMHARARDRDIYVFIIILGMCTPREREKKSSCELDMVVVISTALKTAPPFPPNLDHSHLS